MGSIDNHHQAKQLNKEIEKWVENMSDPLYWIWLKIWTFKFGENQIDANMEWWNKVKKEVSSIYWGIWYRSFTLCGGPIQINLSSIEDHRRRRGIRQLCQSINQPSREKWETITKDISAPQRTVKRFRKRP